MSVGGVTSSRFEKGKHVHHEDSQEKGREVSWIITTFTARPAVAPHLEAGSPRSSQIWAVRRILIYLAGNVFYNFYS